MENQIGFTINDTSIRARIRKWRRDRRYHSDLRDILRYLSQQRIVVDPLFPNIAEIENAAMIDFEDYWKLKDCVARGWVDEIVPLEAPIGTARICTMIDPYKPAYRLTKLGWDMLNRSYNVAWAALVVSFTSLLISVTNFIIYIVKYHPWQK